MLKLTAFGSLLPLLPRMTELAEVVVVERDEEKSAPEEAAIPPEPRTKTELSSDSANRAICKRHSTSSGRRVLRGHLFRIVLLRHVPL